MAQLITKECRNFPRDFVELLKLKTFEPSEESLMPRKITQAYITEVAAIDLNPVAAWTDALTWALFFFRPFHFSFTLVQ